MGVRPKALRPSVSSRVTPCAFGPCERVSAHARPFPDVAYPGDVEGSARVEPSSSTDGAPPEEKGAEVEERPRDRLASIPSLDVMLDSPTPGQATRTDPD